MEGGSNEPKIWMNDNITLLRAIKDKPGVKEETSVKEKIAISDDNEQLVNDNLYKLHKWDPLLYPITLNTWKRSIEISTEKVYNEKGARIEKTTW